MINCLVLGGAGFIGSNVVEALVPKGHRVRVFDLPNASTANLKNVGGKIEVVQGDINNAKDICRALDGMDVLVHLVYTTLPNPSNKNPVYDVETNVVASINLLKHEVKKGIKKVIFASEIYSFILVFIA